MMNVERLQEKGINTLDEAAEALTELARVRAKVDRARATAAKKVAEIEMEVSKSIRGDEEKDALLVETLTVFTETHRALIEAKGKRSIDLGSGKLGFRTNPKALEVTGEEEKIIAFLEENEFLEYVKTKKSLDKRSLLSNPKVVEQVPGLEITQGESTIVEPLLLKGL